MEYKYKWYIPDAYLHSRGTGYFTSHEGCAFINETDRDAHVRFTFYFQDREPMTGYTSVVPARRTKHARFDLMENDKGEPVPMNVGMPWLWRATWICRYSSATVTPPSLS
mgnify:CR=1 FL=1